MNEPHSKDQIQPIGFDAPVADSVQSGFHWQWRHTLLAIAAVVVLLILLFMISAKALLINTNAENSQISLTGGTSLKLGNGRYLVIKDDYELTLSAPGYYPQTLSLNVDSETQSTLNYELIPLPGRIRASFAMQHDDGSPVMGVVRINGSGLGPANELLFKDLAPGDYQIKADAYLYESKTLDVSVRGRDLTEEVSLNLEPNWAYVQFDLQPDDAAIFAGSEPLIRLSDQTLGQVLVEAGQTKLSIKREGYKTWERVINAAKDQQIDLGSIDLQPVDSQYRITTTPSAVSVTVDGQYAGQTPLTLDLLPDVAHQISLFKAGYVPQEHQVTVARDAIEDQQYQLQPDLINVNISVSPKNAQVYVGGIDVNRQNQDGSISVAMRSIKQSIEVKAAGYASQTVELLPVRGSKQLVKIRLLTEEQALWASTPSQYTSQAGHDMLLFRDAGVVPMGSSRREPGRRANEVEWQASLQRAFYVSSKETTNKQYRQFESEHSSGHYESMGLDGPDRPAVQMSWQKAALYCNWLSEKSGLQPFYTTNKGFVSGVNPEATGYRLLTEAEWTYLAKVTPSGLPQRYSWGDTDTPPSKFENFADQSIAHKIRFVLADSNDGFPVSAPVGSFASNAKGIYDLGGNVMEWIHDWYQPIPYETDTQVIDPLGPEEGEFHVIRGASWARGYLPQLRLSYRDYDSKGRNDLGFRVARYAM